VLAEVRRGGIVESRHRGHVVAVAASGEIERAAGDPEAVRR
jgi:L-asparaginase II